MGRGEGTTGAERDQVSLRNTLGGPVVAENAADRTNSKGSESMQNLGIMAKLQ